MEYIANLHKTKASDFGVSFPDFPGCITAGKSLEEARRFAAEALGLHIKGMEEDGEAIPKPSSLDELEGDPSMEGGGCRTGECAGDRRDSTNKHYGTRKPNRRDRCSCGGEGHDEVGVYGAAVYQKTVYQKSSGLSQAKTIARYSLGQPCAARAPACHGRTRGEERVRETANEYER